MKSMEFRLQQINFTLTAVLQEPSALTRLAPFGYSVEKLQEGIAYSDRARGFLKTQKGATSLRISVGKSHRTQWKDEAAEHNFDRRGVQVEFKKRGITTNKLDLESKPPITFPEWHGFSLEFYRTINEDPELQEIVADKLPLTRIRKRLEALDALQTGFTQKSVQKETVGDTRQQRQQAFDEAVTWFETFCIVAYAALRDTPELLVAIGIKQTYRKHTKHNKPSTATRSEKPIERPTLPPIQEPVEQPSEPPVEEPISGRSGGDL